MEFLSSSKNPFRNLHCSAMIKLLENDIYHTHSTWIDYPYMMQYFKTYHFEETIAMSSLPASISSLQDFYATPKFSVIETSLMSINSTLQKLYIHPRGGLLECFRVQIANIYAENGLDWARIFLGESKTQNNDFFFLINDYSNQWFVIDQTVPVFNTETKKFEPFAPDSGLFTIVEQAGPYSQYADWTERLVNDTYIGGYNFAFFPQVQQVTGLTYLEEKYGSLFSTKKDGYARAAIFARNQSDVKSVSDLMS